MDYLWSPWRMQYIQNKEQGIECVFCYAVRQTDDAQYLILHRAKHCFVILNRFPYTSGHLMILPYEHQASYEDLNPETRAEIMETINLSTTVLREIYHPHGFNIGVNIGEDAGAGIAPHVHFHLVPRWRGDSNFMSVTALTRVLPEDLQESYQRLKAAWTKRL
ncbi:MAG: HIT family hydrolase [Chloroflexi bacterium HGW-Chloroflexi-10]|nr:MAG: HIT family hydrolase [Chloroflexi bacterium HGW-Chloroflexi-10]